MAVKTFSQYEVLTASDTNTYLANSGLVYVSTTTWSGSPGFVDVPSCFSSTYDNYRIVISNTTYSIADTTLLVLPGNYTAGNDYFGGGFYQQFGVAALNAYVQGASNNGGGIGITTTVPTSHAFDIMTPYLAVNTRMLGSLAPGGSYIALYSSILATNASYTSVRIKPASGTMTGGTITVYGYRKA